MREDNIIPPETAPITPSPIIKPKTNITGLLLGLIIGILFTSTSAAAYYIFVYKPAQTVPPVTKITPTTIPSPIPLPAVDKIVWFAQPKPIDSINVFKILTGADANMYHVSDAKYYQTATLPDGSKLINVFLPTEGMGLFNELYRFIQSPDNKITYADLNNQWEYKQELLANSITLSNFSVRELDPPETITVDNVFFKKGYLREGTFEKVDNPKLIKETEFGSLYVTYTQNKLYPEIRGREFFLKLKDTTYYSYDEKVPFMSDDMTAHIQYLDGTSNKTQYLNKMVSGCGTGFFGPDTIKDNSSVLSSKEVVANYGQKNIYQLKDSSNTIVKALYDSYKSGRDYPSAPPVVSFENFVQSKNHFLYQDFLSDWLIFVSQDYSPMAECGKPVIYLYPTKDTVTSVKVAADITKSEPTYPESGWTVLAHPDGQLEYQGITYPNLFWEGTGQGIYPDLKDLGFVVSQSNLIPTIKSHLLKLGLNSQESADFLEFWTDKLPSTPYVRLTWLGTADMNRLAPLDVSPRPDTSIRVFLDFEGLDKPTNLVPQKLTSLPRIGFTLVEWGGLLIK